MKVFKMLNTGVNSISSDIADFKDLDKGDKIALVILAAVLIGFTSYISYLEGWCYGQALQNETLGSLIGIGVEILNLATLIGLFIAKDEKKKENEKENSNEG